MDGNAQIQLDAIRGLRERQIAEAAEHRQGVLGSRQRPFRIRRVVGHCLVRLGNTVAKDEFGLRPAPPG
jgi:hypothetical protein